MTNIEFSYLVNPWRYSAVGKRYIRHPPPEGRETASEVPECKFRLRHLRRGVSSCPEYRILQCQSVCRKKWDA